MMKNRQKGTRVGRTVGKYPKVTDLTCFLVTNIGFSELFS